MRSLNLRFSFSWGWISTTYAISTLKNYISLKYIPWYLSMSMQSNSTHDELTHWGRVTHICVGNLTIIGPDNGLSPGRRQAIIWTNAGILLIGPWWINFSEILIGIHTFSFKKINLKMSSAKWRPFCLGLNVLTHCSLGDAAAISDVQIPTQLVDWYFEYLSKHYPGMDVEGSHWF